LTPAVVARRASQHHGDLGAVFFALSSEHRRAILHALRSAHSDGPAGLCITEIAAAVEISRFSATHHLRILRMAGLVETTSVRRRQMSRLVVQTFSTAVDWLLAYADEDVHVSPTEVTRLAE
jgi:DNA-binding transcriptional ArsR family regulator